MSGPLDEASQDLSGVYSSSLCWSSLIFPAGPERLNSWDKFGTIWDNTHLTPLTPTRKHLTLPVEFLTVRVRRFERAHAFLALLITGSLVRVQLGEPVFARVPAVSTPKNQSDTIGNA